MVIKGELCYKDELIKLWSEVFGDDLSYIELFFQKQYSRCETFCFIVDNKIISAFYLLPCYLSYKEKNYNGRYLYAAATFEKYRGKQIMSQLIEEAKVYCKNNDLDFLALLPADEGLYNYYSRFGFNTAMYKYETVISDTENKKNNNLTDTAKINFCKIERIRASVQCDKLLFSAGELEYIITSMQSYGCRTQCEDDVYIIYNEDDLTVEELISSADKDLSEFCVGSVVYTPFSMDRYGKSVKRKFGMIYPINRKLEGCTDIYMNLALD